MEKILPIVKPIVSSYPRYAHTSSVLGAYTQEYLLWVYTYFVQLCAPDELNGGGQLDYVAPDIYAKIPWLEINYMETDIGFKKMNGLQLMKEYINYDFYFSAPFMVSEFVTYKKDREYHDLLIYGYSDEKEEFYFADNYEGGKYEFGVARYAEMENAIENYDRTDNPNINCLKYRNNKAWKTFQFDKATYINFLKDYINKTNYARTWGTPGVEYNFLKRKRWGIDVYSYIQEYLDAVKKSEFGGENRGLYVIFEHKCILEKTLTYVLGEHWKEKYPFAWELLEKDIRVARIAFQLFLDYKLTLDKQLIEQIKNCIAELEVNDYKLFPYLVSILEEGEK